MTDSLDENSHKALGRSPTGLEELLALTPARRDHDWTAANWSPIFRRLGLKVETVRALLRQAMDSHTDFRTELLVSGLVSEDQLYSAAAEALGLPFVEDIEPTELVIREEDAVRALQNHEGFGLVHTRQDSLHTNIVLAPASVALEKIRENLARYPDAFSRIWLAAPRGLRKAILARTSSYLLKQAVDSLFSVQPDFSAKVVANGWQGAAIGAFAVAAPAAFLFYPEFAMATLVGVSTVLFVFCSLLRLAALTYSGARGVIAAEPVSLAEAPIYSVLVALHKESAIVGELLVALGRLVWPRGKLEIKLVCEADDTETLLAISAHKVRHWVEVIEVPPGLPRTKPKALNYALQACSGEFVVLYDAEDRPDPLQLVEAWQHFSHAPENLACVQAPLSIGNSAAGAIPAMFKLEYDVLFRGLLPWLASSGLVMPLGGTSNHFRRKALVEVGAWDPFNVTEDADLGTRLRRFGYQSATISRPTGEDAPEDFGVWLRQRTRWMKGFMQTWLVHMRSPRNLWRELGPASFLVFQILFAGMVASALFHPVFIFFTAINAADVVFHPTDTGKAALLIFNMANLILAYGAFLGIGWAVSSKSERRGFWRKVALMPVYWSMISLAAWRAVFQLTHNPHHWEKTPHKPVNRSAR